MDKALRDALREIANRAGSPTMDYSPANALKEQRASLDWIAKHAADALNADWVARRAALLGDRNANQG